jgi:multiple sugar transport system permease protein
VTASRKTLTAWIPAIALILVAGFPLAWTLLSAFKPLNDIVTSTPKLVFTPTLENFGYVFSRPAIAGGIVNSLVVCGTSVIVGMLLGIPAAYAIATRPPGQASGIRFFILSLRFLPPVAIAIPLIQIWLAVGLFDTKLALAVTYLVLSLSTITWLAIPAFERVPKEVVEAARIDSGGDLTVFLKVVLPIAVPSLIGCVVFAFVLLWNEFLIALMLTTSDAKTLPIVASEFTLLGRNVPWGILNAATVVLSLPPLLFIGILYRFLNSVVRQSAGKES